jgi:hypothetical protein
MKTRISQFLTFFAAVVLLLTATGYDRPKGANAERTCIEILFLNAGNHPEHQPQTVYVTLKDPSGQIAGPDYTTTDWITTNGRIELSLPAGYRTADHTPYRFWIKADAEGFLYNMQAIEVSATDEMEAHIYLVDLADAASGLYR